MASKHLWIVIPIVGLVFFSLGVFVFYQSTSFQPTQVFTDHFTVGRTDSLIPEGLQTAIITTILPQKIWINYQMRLEEDSPWMLVITFPFHVQPTDDAIRKGWHVTNLDNSNNSIAILSNSTLSSDYKCCYFSTEFSLKENINVGNWGSYTILFPITSVPLSEDVGKVVEELTADVHVGWHSDPLDINMLLDDTAQINQSFPPFDDLRIAYSERIQKNVKELSWSLEKPQTILIQYIQPKEFNDHQLSLQLSGVLIGMGISLIGSTAVAKTFRLTNK